MLSRYFFIFMINKKEFNMYYYYMFVFFYNWNSEYSLLNKSSCKDIQLSPNADLLFEGSRQTLQQRKA